MEDITSSQLHTTDTQNIKFVILGNSGVGKSCLVKTLKFPTWVLNPNETLNRNEPSTIGVDFVVQEKDIFMVESNQLVPVKLQLWDTAGQERFKSLILSYCRGVSAIIFVFETPDSDLEQDYASLRALTEWYAQVKREILNDLSEQERDSIICCICMSKYDRLKKLKEPKRVGEQCKSVLETICFAKNDVKRVYITSVVHGHEKNQTGQHLVQYMIDDLIHRVVTLRLENPKPYLPRVQPKEEENDYSFTRRKSNRFTIRVTDKNGNTTESLADQERQSGCC